MCIVVKEVGLIQSFRVHNNVKPVDSRVSALRAFIMLAPEVPLHRHTIYVFGKMVIFGLG